MSYSPSVQLLLVTKRKKKNEKFPLKLRVIYQRKSKDYPVGLDLTEEQYNGAITPPVKKYYKEFEIKINAYKAKAHLVLETIGVFTFDKFKNLYFGKQKQASNIFALFDDYIVLLISEERIKTAISYTTVKNSIKKFKNNVGLYDITSTFLKNYHLYLTQKGVSNTTIGIYMRTLRSIYNYSISLEIIKKDDNYPFGLRKYQIPASRNLKKALNQDEIQKIYSYQIIPGTPEDKARDFWMLSYLCNGINFKDIALMKNKNVEGNMLRYVRAKTKNSSRRNQSLISCHLSEQAKTIISKWQGSNKNGDDFLFTILDLKDNPYDVVKKVSQFIKNTNKYMKRICQAVKLEKIATTYFSRHSAATILKRSGASIENIQEALGHKSSKTTEKYLDSFDDRVKEKLSSSLSDFLK